MKSQVALVIPAWKEEDAIGPVLLEVPHHVLDAVYVVVGSADDPTATVARAHGVRVIVPRRRGYGAACWEGVRAALSGGAEFVAFLDGDYSDPPADLPRLLRPLLDGRADLVLGCRDLTRTPRALPLHAQIGNAFVLRALSLLVRGPGTGETTRLRDLPSFKAIRSSSLQLLGLQERTYGWTVEMLVKALRADLRIEQLDVTYRPRLAGQSKVSGTVRGTLGAAWMLITCALRYARWSPTPGPMPLQAEVNA